MPEGFSSVADLKVIVDANADKFHSGLKGVVQAVEDFNAKSQGSFGSVQSLVDLVGGAALGTSGKLKIMAKAIEGGVALYKTLAAEGRSYAEAIGAGAEYDSLVTSLGNLGMTLQDTVVGAFFATESAAQQAAFSVAGFTAETDKADNGSKSFGQRVIAGVSAVVADVEAIVAGASARAFATSTAQVEKAIASQETQLKFWQERLTELRAAGQALKSDDSWSAYLYQFMNNNQITLALRNIQQFTENLAKLKQAAESLPKDISVGLPISVLDKDVYAATRRNDLAEMGTVEAARSEARLKAENATTAAGMPLSDEQKQWNQRQADEIAAQEQRRLDRDAALQKQRQQASDAERVARTAELEAQRKSRSETNIYENAARDINALEMRQRALQMTSGEVAELTMRERLLSERRRAGLPDDENERIKIDAIAEAYGRGTDALQEAMTAQREMQEFAGVFASSMSSAFSQWTSGAEVDVKSMVSSILSDLAQLALRRQVLEPLFGGGGGSNNGGGLFGSAISSAFGGFRADGGPVESGVPYVVGERGPELFVPRNSGSIVPNGAGGGQAVQIITNIDARGATTDAIAMLKQEMSARDARLEGDVTRIIGNVRDRGIA